MCFLSDNAAVIAVVGRRSARHLGLLHLLRCLYFYFFECCCMSVILQLSRLTRFGEQGTPAVPPVGSVAFRHTLPQLCSNKTVWVWFHEQSMAVALPMSTGECDESRLFAPDGLFMVALAISQPLSPSSQLSGSRRT